MPFLIDNNLLKNDEVSVEYLTTQTEIKNNKTYKESGGILDSLVIHYTAGRSASSSAKFLARKDVKASAHLVIGREGEVYQLVPFDKVSWHAGKSKYGGRNGLNKYSIGIEIDNAGVLNKVGSQYQAWFGKKYMESDVIKAVHRNETTPRYWHTYTDKQLEVLTEIVELLVSEYDLKQILGHEEISPGRKQDPGPAFDLDRFRRNILGQNRRDNDSSANGNLPETGIVDASKLNIREGAGSQYDKVANPLPRNKKVKILDEEDGWYKVETTITGWVSKGYIDSES